MNNCFKYFNNDSCEYFPCHKGELPNFNCLFCYCPLFLLMNCPGNFSLTKKGLKDCTYCNYPHKQENYNKIIEFLKKKKLTLI